MRSSDPRFVLAALPPALLAPAAAAADWNNLSGNRERNGLTSETGPRSADLLWANTEDFSIISWAPYILGDRVYSIREWGFPQNDGPANDALVCYDLETGGKCWDATLPWGGDTSQEWIAWILGVRDGRVYTSRGGNGTLAPIHAYDAAGGDLLWTSPVPIGAFAYEGVVFAPDGDLLVGWHTDIYRLESTSGAVVWHATRSCSVSGSCGPAASATALYIDEVAPGGQIVTKFDIETGDELYSSPVAPGFLTQKSPFLSPDGNTVYYPRTQNNDAVDFLYAFQDTGTALQTLWNVPVHWTPVGYGIGPDGSIYAFNNDVEIVRLDPATGQEVANGGTLEPLGAISSTMMAVGADGTVYVSNGWASTPATDGRLYALPADLSRTLFTLTLDRPNQGGPALAGGGTLVVCDRAGVYAYRTPGPPCPADLDDDGLVGITDLIALLSAWGSDPGGPPDLDGDGVVGITDLIALLAAWGPCP